MNKAIVIGAGWAGLSAAVGLSEMGFQVALLEQSGRLGGRASSFIDPKSGDAVDNGQHLFMGCYRHTIAFLKKIGSLDKLRFQKNLSVDFVNRKGEISTLKCASLPSPLHLFSGLIHLNTLSLQEKIKIAKVYCALKNGAGGGMLKGLTVNDWLSKLGQSDKSRKYFWDLITIATLNELPSIAEAGSLAVVLKEAFFSSKEKSLIAIAAAGLSDLCGPPAEKFIAERNGQVLKNKLVTQIVVENESVQKVILRDGSALTADLYVSAVPFFALRNLLTPPLLKSEFFSGIEKLTSSPIFSIALWFDRAITDREFAAMLDTEVQWLFNKSKIFRSVKREGYVSLVLSGAHSYLTMTNAELLKICLSEVDQCFPESRGARLVQWLIQREKNATLSPQIGSAAYRLSQKTPIRNLFLCGDWTDTGFPATIESAVLSSSKALEHISFL